MDRSALPIDRFDSPQIPDPRSLCEGFSMFFCDVKRELGMNQESFK